MGGRGASSGITANKKGGSSIELPKGAPSNEDLPARANVQIKIKTEEEALKVFRKNFANAKKEHAYVVDDQGFVHSFVHGGKHSVGINPAVMKNKMIYHNHPSGSAFSRADLSTFATSNAKGVVASGVHGDYIIKKTGRFNGKGFMTMLNKTKFSNKGFDDYNSSVDKALRSNARKYGYKYEFNKSKGE